MFLLDIFIDIWVFYQFFILISSFLVWLYCI